MKLSESADFDQGRAPIVVGVSPSSHSPAALRWAADEAEFRNAPLHAVMAWRQPRPAGASGTKPPVVLQGDAEELQAEAASRLKATVRAALGDAQEVWVSVVKGSARTVLLAASEGAQLLVLGSIHQGRIGAIRDQVLPIITARLTCPVVLIPTTIRAELAAGRTPTVAASRSS